MWLLKIPRVPGKCDKCLGISQWAKVEPQGVGGISRGPILSFQQQSSNTWGFTSSRNVLSEVLVQPTATQETSLRITLYRVVRWFALVVSKFPCWPQTRSVIIGVSKTPPTMALFHSSYDWDRECSKAVRDEWTSQLPSFTSARHQEFLVWPVLLSV